MELGQRVRETVARLHGQIAIGEINGLLLKGLKEEACRQQPMKRFNAHKVLFETLMTLREATEKEMDANLFGTVNLLLEDLRRIDPAKTYVVKACGQYRENRYSRFIAHSQKNIFLDDLVRFSNADQGQDLGWDDFVGVLKCKGLVSNSGKEVITLLLMNGKEYKRAVLGLQYFAYPDRIRVKGAYNELTRSAITKLAGFMDNAAAVFYTEGKFYYELFADLFLGHEDREIIDCCHAAFSLNGRRFVAVENSGIDPNELLPKHKQ